MSSAVIFRGSRVLSSMASLPDGRYLVGRLYSGRDCHIIGPPRPPGNSTQGRTLRRALAPPQPGRCDVGALADGSELEPHHRLDNPFTLRESAEPAIGRGDDALTVADGAHGFLNPPRHHFRVLD